MDASIKVDEKKAVQILEEEMKVPKEAMDKLKPSMGKCVTDFGIIFNKIVCPTVYRLPRYDG